MEGVTRHNACDGKKCYQTRKEAKQKARLMSRKKGGSLRDYKCPFCVYYHIGNIPNFILRGWNKNEDRK